jgi:hypothetical protein
MHIFIVIKIRLLFNITLRNNGETIRYFINISCASNQPYWLKCGFSEQTKIMTDTRIISINVHKPHFIDYKPKRGHLNLKRAFYLRLIYILFSSILLTGCSWTHARLTYDFHAMQSNPQVLYEPGTEDIAEKVVELLPAAMEIIEENQYALFLDRDAVRVFIFNDRKRYARFSAASIKSRGSATTNEIYLSEKMREDIDTLPLILIHELSHVHIRQYSGSFKYVTDIPGWFLEGFAVNVSAGGGAESVTAEQAKSAMRNGWHFRAVDRGRISGHYTAHDYGLQPHMYYRQAALFVKYLETSNPHAFARSIRDILDGTRFREVWPEHYGRDITKLWQEYLEGIQAWQSPGSRNRLTAGAPSVAVVRYTGTICRHEDKRREQAT